MTADAGLIRSRTLAAVAALTAATLLVAGCGGGSDGDSAAAKSDPETPAAIATSDDAAPAGATATPDACSILKNTDLEAVWGVAFAPGESSETTPPFRFHVCSFQQTSNQPPARTLTFQVLGPDDIADELRDGGQTPKTLYEGIRDSSESIEVLDGVGDEAYRVDGQVQILSGDLYLTLSAPGASSPEAISGLDQLAKLVDERL